MPNNVESEFVSPTTLMPPFAGEGNLDLPEITPMKAPLGGPPPAGSVITKPPAASGIPSCTEINSWMPMPILNEHSNNPPGLEYLSQIDQLLIKQKVEIFEAVTNIETANKYKIKNSLGQDIFKAKERSDFCTRQCCGPVRCFQLEICDHTGKEVIHCDRPLKCATCCFPCCLQKMTISSPITEEVFGLIYQTWHPLTPNFKILDSKNKCVLKIEGPFCATSCCGDVIFKILSKDGQEIGKITKQWGGLAMESFTDADNFSVSFPLDLDVKFKATLLGAVFLIDFMFFEKSSDEQPGPNL